MIKKIVKTTAILGIALSVPLSSVAVANAAPTNVSVSQGVAVAAKKKAPAKVTIKKIKNSTVSKKNQTRTVKPTYSKAKGVSIKSAKITVKNSKGKTISKNRNSVKLKPGSYKLSTSVKYSYKSGKKYVVKTAKSTQNYKINVAKAKKATVTPKVTVTNLKNTTVANSKAKANIKPQYKKTGKVNVSSAKMTVVNSKNKTVAKNAKSVSLAPGTYTVKTTVSYNYKSGKKTVRKNANHSQKFTVTAKAAAKPKPPVQTAPVQNTADLDKNVINKLNSLRAKKGFSKLQVTNKLDSHVSTWTASKFTKDIPYNTGASDLFTTRSDFSGFPSPDRVVDYASLNGGFMSELYSNDYSHISVVSKKFNGETLIGFALAKF